MELHWNKFHLLPVQYEPKLKTPSGNNIQCQARMEYLGTTLTADSHDNQELVKRIAMAKKDFLALQTVWQRSSLTWKRKLAIYSSLIESKLLYGLSSICLTVAQERQLNGFQNRCLRSIIGVKPSYISRVSNVEVLQRTAHSSATDLLRQRQMRLLCKIVESGEEYPLRRASFIPGTDQPLTDQFVRRRGAPCKVRLKTLLPAYRQEFNQFGML